MKKFFFILLLLTLISINVYSEESTGQMSFTFSFEARTFSNGDYELSDKQFPDFREDEFLIIKKIIIENKIGSVSPETRLTLNLITPDREIENAFMLNSETIPRIDVNSVLEIDFNSIKEEIHGNQKIFIFIYGDNEGRSYRFSPLKLVDVGKWTNHFTITIEGPEPFSYSFSHFDGNVITAGDFKVISKETLQQINTAEIAVSISFIAILLSLVSMSVFVIFNGLRLRDKEITKNNLIELVNIEFKENEKLLQSRLNYFKLDAVFLESLLKNSDFDKEVSYPTYATLLKIEEFNKIKYKSEGLKSNILVDYKHCIENKIKTRNLVLWAYNLVILACIFLLIAFVIYIYAHKGIVGAAISNIFV